MIKNEPQLLTSDKVLDEVSDTLAELSIKKNDISKHLSKVDSYQHLPEDLKLLSLKIARDKATENVTDYAAQVSTYFKLYPPL